MSQSVIRTILEHAAPAKVAPQPDAFSNLDPATADEMRSILAPFQGCRMEIDPVIPNSVGIVVEGRLFRVMVSTHRDTGAERVVILDDALAEWAKDTFLALAPEALKAEKPRVVHLANPPIKRDQRDILEEILDTQKAILAELRRG